MKIVLASESAIKLAAVRAIFNDAAEIVCVKAASCVNEQPFGAETLIGAQNRLEAALDAVPDGDFYVSVESGIFQEGGYFFDRAVVLLRDKFGVQATMGSERLGLSCDYVLGVAQKDGGFAKHTVGQALADDGIVENHADPHLSLTGKSRSIYIQEALLRARETIRLLHSL